MIAVATYLTYLAIALPLTVWVASTLSRNGRVLLADVFSGNDPLADAVNRLLVMGVYLLNLGIVILLLRAGPEALTVRELIEVLSVKIGWVVLLLGVVHLFNVAVLNVIRRHGRTLQLRTQQAQPWTPQPTYPAHPGPAPYPGPVRR